MINKNQNIPNSNMKKITYDIEKIQELLNIIDSLPLTGGFNTAFKMTQIFEIINEPFNLNKVFPNPAPKEINEEKKD